MLLLSGEDDFNALASSLLEGSVSGQVYRIAPRSASEGTVAPYIGTARLFRDGLSGVVLARRYDAGERIHTQPATDGVPAGQELLFLLRRNGRLVPVLQGEEPTLEPGDVAVLIGGSSGERAGSAGYGVRREPPMTTAQAHRESAACRGRAMHARRRPRRRRQ